MAVGELLWGPYLAYLWSVARRVGPEIWERLLSMDPEHVDALIEGLGIPRFEESPEAVEWREWQERGGRVDDLKGCPILFDRLPYELEDDLRGPIIRPRPIISRRPPAE